MTDSSNVKEGYASASGSADEGTKGKRSVQAIGDPVRLMAPPCGGFRCARWRMF
ncbi:hypothetical protein V7S43_010199 [Phytophthora oleae]|uniref:Uncharacterized protein n=1 Tax=Phytophthora oleae TaxID=2107226 RepID=A0ABD3FFE7_9STRA